MSLQNRIDALKEKHAFLEGALEIEESKAHPDDTELAEIKKQKLAIKDELATIHTH